MITFKDGKGTPVVMKLATYLRLYATLHNIPLSPESADEEAAKQGIIIDHSGEGAQNKHALEPDGLHRYRA